MDYVVSGYYGERNAGDEAILAGILQEIGRRDPGARFTVVSFDPGDTRRRHGVEAVSTSHRRPGPLVAALRSADLLVSGGGSFLHEADFALYGRSFLLREGRLRPVPYFLSVVLLARSLGVPVMWYAQGLGPLHTRAARRLVGLAGSLSQVVTWRDRASARLAADVGVRPPVQAVVPDPAYALAPASTRAVAELFAERGFPSNNPFLAVCPRPWLGRTRYLETLVRALARVAAERDLAVAFVPFHERLDTTLCADLAADPRLAERAWTLPPARDPRVLAGVLREAELVVAMRLHSGILASGVGTPAVVVDYDPKTRALAEQTGQSDAAISVDELEADDGVTRLGDLVLGSLDHLARRRRALARAVEPLRAAAGRTAALAVQLATSAAVPGVTPPARGPAGADHEAPEPRPTSARGGGPS